MGPPLGTRMTDLSNDLDRLQELVVSDLTLTRSTPTSLVRDIDAFADMVGSKAKTKKIVYTAFDGDHQILCTLMRQRVAAEGHIAANPDSILGYKETCENRHTKTGVLLDDLAVLR